MVTGKKKKKDYPAAIAAAKGKSETIGKYDYLTYQNIQS